MGSRIDGNQGIRSDILSRERGETEIQIYHMMNPSLERSIFKEASKGGERGNKQLTRQVKRKPRSEGKGQGGGGKSFLLY